MNQAENQTFTPARLLTASRQNLWRLFFLRCLVLVGQAGIMFSVYISDLLPLPWPQLILVWSCSGVICVLTFLRLQFPQQVTEPEYAFYLATDLLMQSMMFYYSGGAANPFVSYYLVPLTIAAATLPWFYSLVLAGIALTFYTVLLVWYYPIHVTELHYQALLINLHLFGMWLNFAFSAGLITFFVVRMADALRSQDKEIARSREDDLRDQQLLAVATQAAGAAHELGTPLSTMSVVLAELRKDHPDNASLQEDITVLQDQVRLCKDSLQHLVRASEADRQGELRQQPVTEWVEEVLRRWHLMRPEVSYHYQVKSGPVPRVDVPQDLTQALLNLLNNEADACPDSLKVVLIWSKKEVLIRILDHGPGIGPDLEGEIGKPFVTTKDKKGFGLGLFLSQISVNRAGGRVKLYNQPEGGALTELCLPVKSWATDN